MMRDVKSSTIKRVGYDEPTRTLIVEFRTGTSYAYDDVPPEIHEALMAAESIGRHFAANVRNQFTAIRVPSRDLPLDLLAAG